ncbi:hypothetical protein DPMN_110908 [Dreissena polymorpha]|uniref:Uncharacterized protein n=1 Tax=Dreissena polymorpha TaxID=45954 RepID=A0A9D4KCW0_DREPO|nr:hypothetical protein DPMN_110908 [Dreissena polymorpha]
MLRGQEDEKKTLYNRHSIIIQERQKKNIIRMGDWNANIGRDNQGDHGKAKVRQKEQHDEVIR